MSNQTRVHSGQQSIYDDDDLDIELDKMVKQSMYQDDEFDLKLDEMIKQSMYQEEHAPKQLPLLALHPYPEPARIFIEKPVYVYRRKPICGDSGGVTRMGYPCKRTCFLNSRGRCKDH